MGIYQDLGLRPIINAAGTVTLYGGSIMDPRLLDVMLEASCHFCPLDEVHRAVGRKIANLLDVEAAYVTSSTACGLVLTTAARMTGTDPDKIAQLPDTTGLKNEIAIQQIHRIAFDQAIRLTGATLVEVPGTQTPPADALRQALNERTAAVFYMPNAMAHPASLSIEQVVEIAHAASILTG